LAKVGRWMSGSASDDQSSPPIYVLDGIAGVGKSTVAITVAQRAASINSLGATFFFSRDQDDRRKAQGFVHTIAYQLARHDTSYGTSIATAITDNPEALDKVLTQQFSLLVTKPLFPLLKQRETPLVLVFDALDECVEPDASEILNLILSSVSQLPNTRVFLTTRPEFGLRSKYTGTSEASVFHLQEIEDFIVGRDISLYVDHSLSSEKIQEALGELYNSKWEPAPEAKEKLVQMSGKLFIFASTAVKFVLDKYQLDPKAQLDHLLSLESTGNNSLTELGDLYSVILLSAKPPRNPEAWLGRFQKIVGAICVLQTPLSALALSNLLGEVISEDTLKATLAHVHSVLAPSSEGSILTYKIHHKSFPDYITGPSCLPEFRVSEEEHHLHLTKYCLQVMNKQLKFNICQVPKPSQYKDLADLVKEGLITNCISAELKYAAFFWTNHLGKLKEFDSELNSLLDEFAEEHLIHWLEVLAYTEQLDQAHQALREALAVSVCQILCSVVLLLIEISSHDRNQKTIAQNLERLFRTATDFFC
jgi:FMN phosphatase YigB (HAD superfamily)